MVLTRVVDMDNTTIKAKFGEEEYTIGILSYSKFGPGRKGGWIYRRPPKLRIWSDNAVLYNNHCNF